MTTRDTGLDCPLNVSAVKDAFPATAVTKAPTEGPRGARGQPNRHLTAEVCIDVVEPILGDDDEPENAARGHRDRRLSLHEQLGGRPGRDGDAPRDQWLSPGLVATMV